MAVHSRNRTRGPPLWLTLEANLTRPTFALSDQPPVPVKPMEKYFAHDLEPRLPFTSELVGYPRRSKYYEVFLITWTLPASVLLSYSLDYLLLVWLPYLLKKNGILNAIQFLLFVVPFQICVLDYPLSEYTHFVLLFNSACCLLYFGCYLHRRSSKEGSAHIAMSPIPSQQLPRRDGRTFNDALATFRSIVYISTAVCIFARDQPCWENLLSKAYTFGTGLMDIGLGCFVVCVGSLGPTTTKPKASVNKQAAMKKAAVQFLILCACGLVKSIAVAVAIVKDNIQFDDSWREYGVHWNAFYSLAVAKLAGTAMELYALPVRVPPLLAGLAVGVGHEALLACCGVAEYVLAPGKAEPHNRAGLLGSNREGVCSAPGLVALYLVGAQLGRWTHAWSQRLWSGGGGLRPLASRLLALMLACLAYRVLLAHLPALLLPESRRLLNLSYCAWISAFSAFCLLNVCLLFAVRPALLDSTQQSGAGCGGGGDLVPLHLRLVDSAGLIYFLASNLLTGLANLLIGLAYPDRENTDGPLCFLFVLLYMVVAYMVAMLAQRLINIRTLTDRLAAYCR